MKYPIPVNSVVHWHGARLNGIRGHFRVLNRWIDPILHANMYEIRSGMGHVFVVHEPELSVPLDT